MSIDHKNPKFKLGIGITVGDSNMHHLAFIYRDKNGVDLRICDLLWHYRFRNDFFKDLEKYYVSGIKLDDHNSKYILSAIDGVSEDNNNTIPYGFRIPVEVYDDKFRYIGNVAGEGLTCATFVNSVFECSGISIIDRSTWLSSPADAAWQQYIVEQLTLQYEIKSEHIEAMEAMIGNVVRYTPLQIFSAGTSNPTNWKLNFQSANILAAQIEKDVSSFRLS